MTRKTLSFVSVAILSGVFSTACELPVGPPARDVELSRVSASYELTQEDLNLIAQGLARALESESLRRELVADLRSSPYKQYSLDFNRYMSLNSLLPVAMRAELPDDLVDRILSGSELIELVIPDPWHRATWEATGDIVVFGDIELPAAKPIVDLATLSRVVHRVDGSSFVWEFGEQMQDPYVKVGARHAPFVPRLAGAVAAANNWNRLTVSTLQSEFSPNIDEEVMWTSDMDEQREDNPCNYIDCNGQIRGKILPSGRTYHDCTSDLRGGDGDNDGLDDECEYEIAYAFRPYLLFDPNERASGRYEHWAVAPHGGSAVRIVRVFYALAYYYDNGAWILGFKVTEHDGDSEWIYFDIEERAIERQGQTSIEWVLKRACLSAHWRSGWGADSSSCRDRRGGDRPTVFVSRGKHGNYFSKVECNNGGHWLRRDICRQHYGDPTDDFEVVRSRNLGGPDTNLGRAVGHRGRREDMWDRRIFCGWQRSNTAPCSGGYGRSLVATYGGPDVSCPELPAGVPCVIEGPRVGSGRVEGPAASEVGGKGPISGKE